MTGKELLEKLQELPEEDLQVNIFVFESGHRYARELDSMEVRKVLGDTAYILLRFDDGRVVAAVLWCLS